MFAKTMSVILITYFTMMHIVNSKPTINESHVIRNSEEKELFDLGEKI